MEQNQQAPLTNQNPTPSTPTPPPDANKVYDIAKIALYALIGFSLFGLVRFAVIYYSVTQRPNTQTIHFKESDYISPTVSQKNIRYDNFFIKKITKPLDQITLMDLPNNSEVRSTVVYGDFIFTSGDGSIIQYSKKTGALISFSDLNQATCDGEMVLVGKYLYAACKIDNLDDSFGPPASTYTSVHYSGHAAIFKINADSMLVEKVIGKNEGLKNQYNINLTVDGDDIWIGTFDGLGLLNTHTNKVSFFHDELGFPEINKLYGISYILPDKDYVWAFFTSHDSSQGGIAMYSKKTNLWKSFDLADFMETPYKFDLFYQNGSFAKTVSGGIQIAFFDGAKGGEKLVEKKYNYESQKWTFVEEYSTLGYTFDKIVNTLRDKYPMDVVTAEKIINRADESKSKMDIFQGRSNRYITKAINGNRYIKTNNSIDIIGVNPPFRHKLVDLPEKLSHSGDFRDGLLYSSYIPLLIEPNGKYGILITYVCVDDGKYNCKDNVDISLFEIEKNKLTNVYLGEELIGFHLQEQKLNLKMVGSLIKISLEYGPEIFEIDTSSHSLKILATPTPTKSTVMVTEVETFNKNYINFMNKKIKIRDDFNFAPTDSCVEDISAKLENISDNSITLQVKEKKWVDELNTSIDQIEKYELKNQDCIIARPICMDVGYKYCFNIKEEDGVKDVTYELKSESTMPPPISQ
ncbi:MAG: hypothetical protein U0525_04480 [Patescibacteria group bacterium]